MSSIIVGFGHKAKHGKDTSVAAIIKARGGVYDIRRYAFADALKHDYVEECQKAGGAFPLINGLRVTHNLPDWVQYEFDAPKDDPICGDWGKQRTLLQWWGEWRRQQDPMYWVKQVARAIKVDDPQIALISDLRYLKEAAWIKLVNGYTVKVTREGFDNGSRHISEIALDRYAFDFHLVGEDGKKAELESLAVSWFDWFVNSLDPKPVAAFGGANVFAA